jgi:hypothetical protein
MLLRELAGEDSTADPPDDAFAVWEYVVDPDTTAAALPKERPQPVRDSKEDILNSRACTRSVALGTGNQ